MYLRKRGSQYRRKLLNGLMVLCSSLSLSARAGAEVKPLPDTILGKTAATYETLRSYQDETLLTVHQLDGRAAALEIPFELKLQRPNKLSLNFWGWALVSNGERYWLCTPRLKQCIEKRFPTGFPEINHELAKDRVTQMANRSLVLSLLLAGNTSKFYEAMAEERLIGTEKIGEIEAYVVEVTVGCHGQARLWIGKEDFLIHQVYSDYPQAIVETVGPPVRSDATAEASSPFAMRGLTETHKYISINKRLPSSTFTLVPFDAHPPAKNSAHIIQHSHLLNKSG